MTEQKQISYETTIQEKTPKRKMNKALVAGLITEAGLEALIFAQGVMDGINRLPPFPAQLQQGLTSEAYAILGTTSLASVVSGIATLMGYNGDFEPEHMLPHIFLGVPTAAIAAGAAQYGLNYGSYQLGYLIGSNYESIMQGITKIMGKS